MKLSKLLGLIQAKQITIYTANSENQMAFNYANGDFIRLNKIYGECTVIKISPYLGGFFIKLDLPNPKEV